MRIVPLVLLLTGCGRIGFSSEGTGDASVASDGRPLDDAGLGDPNGYWVWTSGKIAAETQTRTRADLLNGVFGDLVIAGSNANGRVVLLGNGAPTTMGATAGTVVFDDGRWIVGDGTGGIAVYDAVWTDADHVALTANPTAPEAIGTPLVDVFAIERTAPPPSELQGPKSLLRVDFPTTGDIPTNQCSPFQTSDSQIVSGTTMTSAQFIVTIQFVFRYFGGSSCQGIGQVVQRDGIEYLEATGGAYRLYLDIEGSVRMTATGTLTIDATSIRFDQTGCIPAGADCNDLPTMLLLTR